VARVGPHHLRRAGGPVQPLRAPARVLDHHRRRLRRLAIPHPAEAAEAPCDQKRAMARSESEQVVRVCCTVLCYKEGRATVEAPEAVYIPAVPACDHVGVAAVSFSIPPVPPAAPARCMYTNVR
jgi:hypothetical protein